MSESSAASKFFSRRQFLGAAAVGVSSAALSACTTAPRVVESQPVRPAPILALQPYRDMYGAMRDGGFDIPAVPIERLDRRFYRQMVPDPTGEMPGTLVVDTSSHHLYLVQPGGEALRYGVGLGRQGFEWSGRGYIEWKQEWPRWCPPDEMIGRQPELEQYRCTQVRGTNRWEGGMQGGLNNPLGARAHYIYQNGRDTLYRIHGSPEWWSIGTSVSSGCVRMINQDVIDLYNRVPEKTPLVVTSGLRVA